ncbi:hypothetical protein H6P81_009466 [Aristolochia fimbriata]|uniref:Uncharacterized protein n=1 Tax=Aristolochia fimbriata TaxID=158543 RepID=A0AAV7ENN2_ARIFI|nr:hypothetical protein H6P81_009466 [Aristolochia fimbriata]
MNKYTQEIHILKHQNQKLHPSSPSSPFSSPLQFDLKSKAAKETRSEEQMTAPGTGSANPDPASGDGAGACADTASANMATTTRRTRRRAAETLLLARAISNLGLGERMEKKNPKNLRMLRDLVVLSMTRGSVGPAENVDSWHEGGMQCRNGHDSRQLFAFVLTFLTFLLTFSLRPSNHRSRAPTRRHVPLSDSPGAPPGSAPIRRFARFLNREDCVFSGDAPPSPPWLPEGNASVPNSGQLRGATLA